MHAREEACNREARRNIAPETDGWIATYIIAPHAPDAFRASSMGGLNYVP